MPDIQKMTKRVIDFRDARDWKQYHNPKDAALSLVLESAEVMEHFQWKSQKEMENHIKDNKSAIAAELADVFYWVLLMSHDFEIDLIDEFEKKMLKNEAKYPVDKASGKHNKYTQL